MSTTAEIVHKTRRRRLAIATVLGTTLFGLGRWYASPAKKSAEGALLDQFLPNAEFNGEVSVIIHAPPSAIFEALRAVTLADMPLANAIGEIRYLPGRLAGKGATEETKTRPFMDLVIAGNGNIILAEETERELVIGAVAKYHNLMDQQVAPLHSPQEFLDFVDPDYQKLAMSFRVTGHDRMDGYRLTLEHRTHALSPTARWKFALYWLGIKPGGNFVSWLLLRAIKRRAEALVDEDIISYYTVGE
ncbi:MAG TPA: hypothetical protein PKE45_25925 [Caldilineaceae bacterium]|nr:hypothetical protein [Caldilineaceae bacterium]